MRRNKITRFQFMLVAGLFLALLLALVHISELRCEQSNLLAIVRVLAIVSAENQAMAEQLGGYRDRVDELLQRNSFLEEILFWRSRSYLAVTESQGPVRAAAALPSRSGLAEAGPAVTALNMPVWSRSGFTEADFEHVWRVFNAGNLAGTGKTLLQAEQDYGINALVLAAIIVHESAWGKSAIAVQKNNLAGLGAYDHSPFSSAFAFAAKEDSIIFLADLIKREYITPGGRYYNSPDLQEIGKRYATDPQWARKVAAKMKLIVLTAVEDPEIILTNAERR
jgi:hypothetical protein